MTEQELQLILSQNNDYQEMLSRCRLLEEDYLRIKSQLSEIEQEQLDEYISLCEGLEYMRTWILMQILNEK